jgi:hypothetical protein
MRRAPAGYALLVRRLPKRGAIFPGRFFRAGSRVEETELRPSAAWPEIPLLIEFAGNDGAGHGWNRAPDVHILWRYDRGRREFEEIARVRSHGAEWFHHLAPIVDREIRRPDPDHVEEARAASLRLVAALDLELDELADEGQRRALAMLYDQVAARLAQSIASEARPLRPALIAGSREGKRRRAA